MVFFFKSICSKKSIFKGKEDYNILERGSSVTEVIMKDTEIRSNSIMKYMMMMDLRVSYEKEQIGLCDWF